MTGDALAGERESFDIGDAVDPDRLCAEQLAQAQPDVTRGRTGDGPCPELPRTEAQVRLFAVHEEPWIEAAQPLPQFAVNEEQAVADDVYFSHSVTLPAPQRLRVKDRAAAKERRKSDGVTERAPGCCSAARAAWLGWLWQTTRFRTTVSGTRRVGCATTHCAITEWRPRTPRASWVTPLPSMQ